MTGVGETVHIGEVEWFIAVGRIVGICNRIGWLGPGRFALETREQLAERSRVPHVNAGHERGLRRAGRGNDHALRTGTRDGIDGARCAATGGAPSSPSSPSTATPSGTLGQCAVGTRSASAIASSAPRALQESTRARFTVTL